MQHLDIMKKLYLLFSGVFFHHLFSVTGLIWMYSLLIPHKLRSLLSCSPAESVPDSLVFAPVHRWQTLLQQVYFVRNIDWSVRLYFTTMEGWLVLGKVCYWGGPSPHTNTHTHTPQLNKHFCHCSHTQRSMSRHESAGTQFNQWWVDSCQL